MVSMCIIADVGILDDVALEYEHTTFYTINRYLHIHNFILILLYEFITYILYLYCECNINIQN